MSLQQLYERFLASPDAAALSDDASLNYIPTTSSFNEAAGVIKHLTSQARIVKKKSDKLLSAIEGPNSLCLDVETTLELVSGGGAYLPGLDDNFIADRVVTFPMVHIVHFDGQNKIQQIRLYWDQASLLKQVEVIGSRARSWPVRDAVDQIRLITSAKNSAVAPAPAPKVTASEEPSLSSVVSPSKKRIQDPHASLSLFALESPEGENVSAIAPKASAAKPPPRDYGDLFVGDEETTPTKASGRREPGSAIAPKYGAGKNYHPSRLFDTDEPAEPVKVAGYKSDPKKYNHFEFADGHDEVNVPRPAASQPTHNFPGEAAEQPERRYISDPKKYDHFEFGANEDAPKPTNSRAKHNSQWKFEDFMTPEKVKPKIRDQDERHFGWSDDEGENAESPKQLPKVNQPRRDAEPHFKFQDESTPEPAQKNGRMRGAPQNSGMGLYQNNLYDEETGEPTEATEDKAPLAIMPNGVSRKKDFDRHWEMSDKSPADSKKENENKHVSMDRQKAVNMMTASWDSYDVSPEPTKAAPLPKRASRHAGQRTWGLGDDDEF